MKKINLKAGEFGGNSSGLPVSGSGGIFLSIFILFLTAVLYGVSYYFLFHERSKKEELKKEMVEIRNSLDRNQEFQKLYIFQEKLFNLADIFKSKVGQADLLSHVSSRTLDRNTVKSINVNFKDDSREMTLVEEVPDLSSLAEQIGAYNAIDKKGQAVINDAKLQGGVLEATLSFSFNKTLRDEKSEQTKPRN